MSTLERISTLEEMSTLQRISTLQVLLLHEILSTHEEHLIHIALLTFEISSNQLVQSTFDTQSTINY